MHFNALACANLFAALGCYFFCSKSLKIFSLLALRGGEDEIVVVTSFTALGRVCYGVGRVSLTSIVLWYISRMKMLQFVRSINSCTR